MQHGLGLNKILGTIHTYPTLAEANKYAAGALEARACAGAVVGLGRALSRVVAGKGNDSP
jgi:hypothetical protein